MARTKKTARMTALRPYAGKRPAGNYQYQGQQERERKQEQEREQVGEHSHEEAQLCNEDGLQYVEDESQFFVSPTSPTYKELEEYNNQQELAELRKEDKTKWLTF